MRHPLPGLLFLTLLSVACTPQHPAESLTDRQNRLFRQDAQKVLSEVDTMLARDQSIRHLLRYGTSDTLAIDSLTAVFAQKGIALDSLLLVNKTYLVGPAHYDSMIRRVAAQDSQHTVRMIALINRYGYPDSYRIDSSLHISPFLVLHHPYDGYKDTILSLLRHELAAGRIDTISYEMIRWDYNGREGLPDIPTMKVQKNKDGTKTITL